MGEAPGHTSWAIPAPGERLQAPSWLPHPAPILLARGLGSGFCKKGLGTVAASLPLPPEAWVLASVLGGNSVHFLGLRDPTCKVNWLLQPHLPPNAAGSQQGHSRGQHCKPLCSTLRAKGPL